MTLDFIWIPLTPLQQGEGALPRSCQEGTEVLVPWLASADTGVGGPLHPWGGGCALWFPMRLPLKPGGEPRDCWRVKSRLSSAVCGVGVGGTVFLCCVLREESSYYVKVLCFARPLLFWSFGSREQARVGFPACALLVFRWLASAAPRLLRVRHKNPGTSAPCYPLGPKVPRRLVFFFPTLLVFSYT